jgi:eukaryotic-like serine/threonine-protein kinase
MPLLEPDRLFGSYRLVAPLSRGGMGEVWRAVKLDRGARAWSRQVALKVILPGFADSEQFADLFASEARIAASLVHANIVSVSTFGEERGILFLEQELVDGADLARLVELAPGGLPIPIAIFVVVEALKGLAFAHDHALPDGQRQTVIHRDLKPANVLVAREGHVKLADFGIARIASGSGHSLTQLRGTVGYLAPELLAGRPPSTRSDVFAMGLILWELLTGRKLFAGDNDAVRLFKTYECVVPPLATVRAPVPPELEAVVRRFLARDPAERYPHAEEALGQLLAAPYGRSATSVELKAYLGSLGVRGLPTIDLAPLAPLPAVPTGTAAGELSGGSRAPGSRAPLLALLAVAAVGAGTLFALQGSDTAAVSPAARAPAVAGAPDAVPAVAEPRPGDAAPAVARVTFRISPEDALVTVDDAPLGPPHVLEVAPGRTLRVAVQREGFAPATWSLTVDAQALVVPVALVPQPPAPPAARPAARRRPAVRPPPPSSPPRSEPGEDE